MLHPAPGPLLDPRSAPGVGSPAPASSQNHWPPAEVRPAATDDYDITRHTFGNACYWTAWDGRLDNRDDLIRSLAPHGASAATDAELVVHAWRRWGRDCPARLLGDFAFLIWEPGAGTAFAARDVVGIRPFCYHLARRGQLLFAPNVARLLEAGAPRRVNEGMVAEHLADMFHSRGQTLYRDIDRLPPAHTLTWKAGRAAIVRYWEPDLSRQLHYASLNEYGEHLLALLRSTVAARLDRSGACGVLLSGGVDSGAVAAAANQARLGSVTGYTLGFPGAVHDESRAAREFATTLDIPLHVHAFNAPAPSLLRRWLRVTQDCPPPPNILAYLPLAQQASEDGCEGLFKGSGADDWLDNAYSWYPDLIRSGRPAALVRRLVLDIRQDGVGYTARHLLHGGLRPLLPTGLRRLARKVKPRQAAPRWLRPEFAAAAGFEDRARVPPAGLGTGSYGQLRMQQGLTSACAGLFEEMEGEMLAAAGLRGLYPFHDRRVIEFGFSLPPRLRWESPQRKPVLRRALDLGWPALAGHPFRNPEGSPMFADSLLAPGIRLRGEDMAISRLGWVDGNAVDALFEKMAALYRRGDGDFGYCVRPLWLIMGIEFWYRHCIDPAG